jgi:hypothetical protein
LRKFAKNDAIRGGLNYIYEMSETSFPTTSIIEEFIKIALVAKPLLPEKITGQEAILAMKDGGSRNWRQMEWIGWWFEYFVETEIKPRIGNTLGPKYGNTTFDFKLNHVWDLKAHPEHKNDLLLNDQVAIKNCARENNGVGFIIVEGEVDYDDDNETFKNWHDQLKGKQTKYVQERIARNAPSRRRKASFKPTSIVGIWLPSVEGIAKGIKDGWIAGFQENMRNSDGKPRNAKFKFVTSKIPESNIVGEVKI